MSLSRRFEPSAPPTVRYTLLLLSKASYEGAGAAMSCTVGRSILISLSPALAYPIVELTVKRSGPTKRVPRGF